MNFKFYYNVVRILDPLGIKSIHKIPTEPLPNNGLVISTITEKKFFEKKTLRKSTFEFNNSLNFRIIFMKEDICSQEEFFSKIYRNGKIHQELIIGVDPGKHVGIYIEADGKELSKFVSVELKYIAKHISDLIKKVPSKRRILKIGNGIGIIEVLRHVVFPLKDKFEVFIVNEENTSAIFRHNNGTPRILTNELSAKEIAKRDGVLIKNVDKLLSDYKKGAMIPLSRLANSQ